MKNGYPDAIDILFKTLLEIDGKTIDIMAEFAKGNTKLQPTRDLALRQSNVKDARQGKKVNNVNKNRLISDIVDDFLEEKFS